MLEIEMLIYIPELFGVNLEVYSVLLFIGVSTFFLWRWISRKFIKRKWLRVSITWITTIVSTLLIYIGLLTLWLLSMSYYPTQNFNKEKWFSDKEKRYELSRDIIDRKILIGKSKLEVRQLLGDEGNTDENDSWSFYLGLRPGFTNIDPDVLSIEFENGKVIRVKQLET